MTLTSHLRRYSTRWGTLVLLALFTLQCSTAKKTTAAPDEPTILPSSDVALRQDIVALALRQEGNKYQYAGRDPKTGFDCSGLTYYVLDHFGISVSPVSSMQAEEGRKIRVDDVQPGDLIYFKRSPAGKVFHVSMVVENNGEGITVVHSVSRGVVVENITTSSYWKPKIAGARDVISK